MKGRRNAAEDSVVKRMTRNESVMQRSGRRYMLDQQQDSVGDAGAMANLLPGSDATRDYPAEDNPPNAMIRRKIEMYREAQLLRQHLSDSFDP